MKQNYNKLLIKGSFICLFVLLFIFIMQNTAFAADASETVFKRFEELVTNGKIASQLQSYGTGLFKILFAAQFAWNLIQLFLDGKFDLQALFMTIIRQMFVGGVYYYLLTHAVGSGSIFNNIINGFATGAMKVCGMTGSFDPLDIVGNGINLVKDMFGKAISGFDIVANVCRFFEVAVASLFIMYSIIQIAMTAAVTYLRAMASSCILVYFLGFGGSDYTKDIAIATVKTVFMAAVELFTIIILIGICNSLFEGMAADLETADLVENIVIAFQMAVAAWLMQGLISSLPSMISGVITGAGQGSGGSNTAMGQQLASLMAGAATMAGGMALTGAGAAAEKTGSFAWGKFTNAISNRFGGNNEVTSGGSTNVDNKSDGGKGLVDFANSQEKGGGSIAYKAAKTTAGVADTAIRGAGKAATGTVKGTGNFVSEFGKRIMKGESVGSALSGSVGKAAQDLGYAAKGMFAKKSSSGEIEAGDNTPPPPPPQNEPFKEGTSNDLEVEKKDGGSADTTQNSSQTTQGTADTANNGAEVNQNTTQEPADIAQKEVEVNPQNVTTQETTETTTKTTTKTETTEKIEKEGTTETTEK